jgi:hypothetical protein
MRLPVSNDCVDGPTPPEVDVLDCHSTQGSIYSNGIPALAPAY